MEAHDTKKYSHLSVSAAISEDGQMYFEVRLCSFNGKAIVLFLKNGFTGRKRRKVSIIWDGASIHKCQDVKDFLEQEAEKQGRVWLELLPPYSPELNPVELLWAHLKGNVLKNLVCKTLTELKGHVVTALEEIQQDKELIMSFFKHPKVGFI